ncbi:MAG TPA: class IV adenylate cyclase [Thermoanaerobaculia bacterium]|nr:class IV adenylate cyclase [Thermoanaerobaculia bacterium]
MSLLRRDSSTADSRQAEPAGPNQERELKFALAGQSLDEVRQRLAEAGAQRKRAAARECNWVFDRRDELFGSSRLLRLRTDGSGCRLTFKGPPRFEENLKVRDEIEVTVAHAEAMRDLLVRLGYRVVRRYEKVREEWQLGGVTVALDHTPIGDFVEFEGDDAVQAATRMAFDPGTAERRSYLRLYEDWRRDRPELPADMMF